MNHLDLYSSARYTRTDSQYVGCLVPGEQRLSLNQSNVSWRVGADWTGIDNTLLYTTVSKGFKFSVETELLDRSLAITSALF